MTGGNGNDTDIWRNSLLRYAGYANELGESFRPIFPKFVVPSYGISFAYVFGDTYDKSCKAKLQAKSMDSNLRTLHVARSAIDTLLWQSLASVVVPGITIHQIVHMTSKLIERQKSVPFGIRRWAPTLVGLTTIPFIIHPLDNVVHFLLDLTVRPAFDYAAYRVMHNAA